MGNACNNRNSAGSGLKDNFDNPLTLRPGQISELSGAPQRGEPMNSALDEMVHEGFQYVLFHLSIWIDGRNQIRKNPFKFLMTHRSISISGWHDLIPGIEKDLSLSPAI
jgi:hypothetical protein